MRTTEPQAREGSEFQSYEGFSVEYRDGRHMYWGHIDGRRDHWVSVTSAIGILDKPALRQWYAREAAIGLQELTRNYMQPSSFTRENVLAILREKGFGPEVQRDAGAERGNAVHAALRAYCETGRVPALKDYPEAHRGYVQALCAALVDLDPEPQMVEQIVGSPKHGFAGRLDLICNVGMERQLWDAKTSPNAHKYPEAHLQVGGGYPACFPECGIEPVDKAMILVLDESGEYVIAEAKGTPEDFLAILGAHKALSALKKALRDD